MEYINECTPAPCKNGATCTNLQNAYSCACSPGWQGINCDQALSTTKAPETTTPTTQAPITIPPTTQAPITIPPTTQAPTTISTTTKAPETTPPTTQAPTTKPPTTQAPITIPPTTQAPITISTTTKAPDTTPLTTQAPTTKPPTTQAPTTQAPTTKPPTTQAPTTKPPTTQAPGTKPPTTQAPIATTSEPVNGAWSEWGGYSACTVTCGNGRKSKQRFCNSPAPSNGGEPCFGQALEMTACTEKECPSDGDNFGYGEDYVQRCPQDYFTCLEGSITCIQKEFVCDCSSDCDDGSDENTQYANCPATVQKECDSSAAGVTATAALVMFCGVLHFMRT
ncbi:integumentary mucin A.1-like [Dreissena polymorpha]|uniref:integumentary mucin A.1-like n=1 Tax=Dreissena polymorpha TaxID=45954 RepID=UPI0022646FC9|nr:integumentary mucin A.1-like [Dreissena polymorpha]